MFDNTLQYQAEHLGKELGKPFNVYNKQIVAIKKVNIAIKVGDLLIAKTENSAKPYLAGEIQSIQVDSIDRNEIAANENVDIGMKVAFHAKDNQTFYIVPKQP